MNTTQLHMVSSMGLRARAFKLVWSGVRFHVLLPLTFLRSLNVTLATGVWEPDCSCS